MSRRCRCNNCCCNNNCGCGGFNNRGFGNCGCGGFNNGGFGNCGCGCGFGGVPLLWILLLSRGCFF
ncbi:hypothetical protein K5V21_09345 [Clostridium sardiniense]|uniref:Ground-like protein n=1 Tax=Clostridium sardiniense TaxID=29369 RepID=A0ABS7KXW8_CLOSR|nr:hypothetical protein [Clostridium sardiniense]MBY0755665.1 hypothetical protein [Clostridium sardiniense]MDQ0462153.1 hypothetical protein [Clostridium sardiniense]